MLDVLIPEKNENSKDVCVDQLEALILSGGLEVEQKLPPQRVLAEQFGVSRQVVHEALLHLADKGLVKIVPRVGTLVNDYRKEGSIALLTSLLKYQQGTVAPKLLDGLLGMRCLFEIEFARLAAICRTDDQIRMLRKIIAAEEQAQPSDIEKLTVLDFDFHHTIAMASGNQIYPLLLNSFKSIYTNMTAVFFSNPQVVPTVIGFHRDMTDAVENQQCDLAVAVMRCLLSHGEELLKDQLHGVPN